MEPPRFLCYACVSYWMPLDLEALFSWFDPTMNSSLEQLKEGGEWWLCLEGCNGEDAT